MDDPTKGGRMYWNFKKTSFLALLMMFSALTYFSQAYASDRLIARDERFQGGGSGGERGAYHPGQGNYGGDRYNDQGHSYSSQDRAMGAYGVGATRGYNQGYNQGEYNEQGSTQYVPVNPYEPNSTPQPYPYTQQPY